MDRKVAERWYQLSTQEQISNIGSEVHRAIRFKNKKDEKKALGFVNVALDFLGLSQSDPKNRNRIQEFGFCKEELIDYFIGENIYQTTDEMLIKYYDAFL